jgi:hypothetical protein
MLDNVGLYVVYWDQINVYMSKTILTEYLTDTKNIP